MEHEDQSEYIKFMESQSDSPADKLPSINQKSSNMVMNATKLKIAILMFQADDPQRYAERAGVKVSTAYVDRTNIKKFRIDDYQHTVRRVYRTYENEVNKLINQVKSLPNE